MWKSSTVHLWQRTVTRHGSGVFWVLPQAFLTYSCVIFYLRCAGMRQADSVQVPRGRAHWRLNKNNKDMSFRENNTGCKMTLEEDSSLPFPCQVKHKNYWGEKKLRVKHLWRWSADSKGQRGSVSFATAPGWPGWSQTHPLLQRHSHVVCLSVIQRDSTHRSLSYKYQREKLRTWSNKAKRVTNTHLDKCVLFFFFKGQSVQ